MKAWHWAVLISVGLHGVLLVPLWGPGAPAPSPPLRTERAFDVTRVAFFGPPRGAPPPQAAASVAGPRGRARSEEAVVPTLSAEPSGSAAPAQAPAGASAPAVAGVVSELEMNGAPGGAQGSVPGDAVAAVDLTALVHARLAAAADGCYPAAARRFRQRGTVELAFCTDASGGTTSSTVSRTSGAELLDAAARGCVVDRAAPFPPEAASRCFSVPVRFGALQ